MLLASIIFIFVVIFLQTFNPKIEKGNVFFVVDSMIFWGKNSDFLISF
jgi:hypothetical protein